LGYDIGASLARGTAKNIRESGPFIIALQGELGAGKTTFVQGFLKGLGSKKRVASPTFVLMRRHKLVGKKIANVFHIDAYRLKKPEHLAVLGLGEIMANPRNVVLIEWPEQAKDMLPDSALWIKFKHGRKENERTIIIKR
jgi:tRNA threonylcarbamoyl adenosine modification protein YjeE